MSQLNLLSTIRISRYGMAPCASRVILVYQCFTPHHKKRLNIERCIRQNRYYWSYLLLISFKNNNYFLLLLVFEQGSKMSISKKKFEKRNSYNMNSHKWILKCNEIVVIFNEMMSDFGIFFSQSPLTGWLGFDPGTFSMRSRHSYDSTIDTWFH